MSALLKQVFLDLLKSYTNNAGLIDELWLEIEDEYSDTKRKYHTLVHLENVYTQLLSVKEKIKNWNTVLFTLFYHDIIYKASKSDNEEKSALFASKRMKKLLIPETMILLCTQQIIATQNHLQQPESDTNYFTDADLSVLGQCWSLYEIYFNQVRKEYSMYPDFLYNPGRKKVLNHFLMMDRIFKTDYFFNALEENAKSNLKRELQFLERK